MELVPPGESGSWFWRDVAIPFAATRVGLLIVGLLAVSWGPMSSVPWRVSTHDWIDIWARWDSGYYFTIAAVGYSYAPGTASSVAFLPLYPLLMRVLALGSQDRELLVVVGWVISNASTLVALACLHQLITLDGERDIARRAIWLLVLFPTSFFFSAVYTEGLFLMLTVAAFYSARRGWWLAAGVCGGLGAATRFVGALLILPLVCEWYLQRPRRGSSAWPLLLIPSGLLAYMLYLAGDFGDPLLFVRAQSTWGRATSIASAPERVAYVLNYLRTASVADIVSRLAVDLAFTVVGCALLVGLTRRQRLSYQLYCLIAIGVPLATLHVMSMSRFLIVIFPFFIAMARWAERSRARWYFLLATCGGLQVIFFARWSLWYWVI